MEIRKVIENEIRGDDIQILQFVTGGAEKGKSFALKLLFEHVIRCYRTTVDLLVKAYYIEVAASTGIAAR